MQKQVSPWALGAAKQLSALPETPEHILRSGSYTFELHLSDDSLWIISRHNTAATVALRTAYSPAGLAISKISGDEKKLSVSLLSDIGKYSVDIELPESGNTIIHYNVKLTPANPLNIPYWPKDVLILGDPNRPFGNDGDIHVSQIGIRSGLSYAAAKDVQKGSLLYFQDLTSINEYCSATETSAGGTVSGNWPEFGFSLPPTKEKPLPAGREFIISDAYVSFNGDTPTDQFQVAERYIDNLAAIYRLLPKPDTTYQDFLKILNFSIHDINVNKGCWSQHKGCSYLNAYVCDYATPPEVMVQLAVLLPIWDYSAWAEEELPCANQIHDNLHTFYDEKLKTINRWLPAVADQLDESEEQKVKNTMDAWYLHHPLLNLGRMALQGDKVGKELFLGSVDFAIKVAHHFDYKWPVFYNMETLEVLKEETQPGMGGEKDVAGVYAQVMLQAWDLTKDKRFFEEAEKAAQSLVQFGFDIFYQANNTAFSAKAMLRLYKETKNELYLKLCHLHVANLMKNVAIWECNYGYGVNFPLFFGLFPLNDAPYMAVYEEQESFSSLNDLLVMAQDVPEFSENARLLAAEYIRYMINRAAFYLPPMLPKDMLSDEVKTGEIDPKLWIALEDIHDGWEQAGVVGQEVYGAGLCFGIVPRHYIRIPDQTFMVYIDYPTTNRKFKGDTLTMDVLGSPDLTCRLSFVDEDGNAIPEMTITTDNAEDQEQINAGPKGDDKARPEYEIHGGQTISIQWGKTDNKKPKTSKTTKK